MLLSIRTTLFAGCCIASLACASGALAQDQVAPTGPIDTTSRGPYEDEIIVTANKREESINKVGITIKAIGEDDLTRQQIHSLEDIAKAVPSLSYTQTEQGTPVYTLRGIGFYDTSLGSYPTVSVYMDQAPLPFPVLTQLTAFDLERIEVLKGPQGILFGNNATGGAINYIASKPTNSLSAGGSVSFGRFNTITGDGFVSGPLTETLRGRAAISVGDGDGYQISASRPTDRNGATRRMAGRILLDWTPSDKMQISVNLNGWRNKSDPPAAQFAFYQPTFAPVPVGGSPFVVNAVPNNRIADWSTDTPPSANNRLLQSNFRIDYELGSELTLTSLTSFTDYKHDQVPEGDGLPLHRQDFQYNIGSIKSFSQELRLSNNVSSRLRWLVGANFSRDKVREESYVNYTDGTTGANPVFLGWRGNGFSSQQLMKNYAGFANAEFVAGKFTLKVGGRFTRSERDTNNCVFALNDPNIDGNPSPLPAFFNGLSELLSGVDQPVPGTRECFNIDAITFLQGPYIRTLSEQNLSWRVGADFNLSDTTLLYLNLSKGYKAGGFPMLSGTGTAFDPVTQESVLSVEGGIKAQLFDRRLSVNLAGFYFDYSDKQLKSKTIDPVFGAIDALVNIPESSIRGVELEIQARPVTGLSLGAAVTFLDASIDTFTGVAIDGSLGNFAGTRIPYTPRWQLAGNANYTFPISDNAEIFAGGQVSYRSATNSVIGSPERFELPSYAVVDLQAGVEFEDGRYKVMAWGKNVFDQFYLTNVVSAVVDGNSRFAGRPATYGITLAFHY